MSTRLGLSGFDLDKMRSLFGCGDQAVIAEMEAGLERAAKEEDAPEGTFDAGFCETFRTALHQAVEGGIPLAGLTDEGLPHAHLADRLANYQQRHLLTDCDYKYLPLLDFLEEYGEHLSPSGRKLFGYLVEGRPLFGQKFRDTPLYGYLSFEEAGELQSCLGSMAGRELEDEDIEELVSDFVEFLAEIRSEERDVWAFVS